MANPTNPNDPAQKFPATGGFPGYEITSRLFLAWTKALKSQADLLNAAWGSMKDGTYTMGQAMSALAKSLEIPAELLQDLWLLPSGGEFVPAWVQLACKNDGVASAVKVSVTRLLTTADNVKASALSLLGGTAQTFPTVTFDTQSRELRASATSAVTPGQYIGLLSIQQSPSPPLAIVVVTVESTAPVGASPRPQSA
jgi:hypothetical protein